MPYVRFSGWPGPEPHIILSRAVDLVEITFYQLNAGIMAGSYLGSIHPSLTARVLNRAVDLVEITFELLLVKIWNKQVLPSPIVKIKKRDCFYSIYISGMAADSTKSELT